MEYIKSWLKTILYMNILLLICDNLMQKTVYEKYYRFFSGFLLVLCLLKPVIDFAGTESYFHASFLQEQWKSERNLLKSSDELQDMEAVIKKESEAAYTAQIKELADNYGIEVKAIKFRWDGAGEKIRKIEISGSRKKAETEKQNASKKSAQSTQTKGVQTKKLQTKKLQIEKLQNVIMQLYDLKESDVRIEVE